MARITTHKIDKDRVHADVIVIGSGACGLVAALSASDAGAEVVVLERDAVPAGSTAMSSGFVPAAGTRFQTGLGITDSPDAFERDIQLKAAGSAEPVLARTAARTIGATLEWLADDHGLEWIVLDDFDYPGHSAHRMHAVPERTGAALMNRLLGAVAAAGVTVLTDARAEVMGTGTDRDVRSIGFRRPDATLEWADCDAVILACGGFGGDRELVDAHIPDMRDAPYYGHAGNVGDALTWTKALGGESRCLTACQGHGSLASPHNILITWALMMEGGIQVNTNGQRFSNEHLGYSEQAVPVLRQPGGAAWDIFDGRLLALARSFPDFQEAEAAGAVRFGDDVAALADATGLPGGELSATLEAVQSFQRGRDRDPFGRDFTTKPPLAAPYCAVRVTGALFHTQGGPLTDAGARVLRKNGEPFPNLFAGGGAACGVSGSNLSGYLSGNGLLTAIAFGAIAGRGAAAL